MDNSYHREEADSWEIKMKAEVSRLGIKSMGDLSAIETITTGKQSMQLLILP